MRVKSKCSGSKSLIALVTFIFLGVIATNIAFIVLKLQEPVQYGTWTPTTGVPTIHPTLLPTRAPTPPTTFTPTKLPTSKPTSSPTPPTTFGPTKLPTQTPSLSPTPPTKGPTSKPTTSPTPPTRVPTAKPTTLTPSAKPTVLPTILPTFVPTTASPSLLPTTASPTTPTTLGPSKLPTAKPTSSPTTPTTFGPSSTPSISPTVTGGQGAELGTQAIGQAISAPVIGGVCVAVLIIAAAIFLASPRGRPTRDRLVSYVEEKRASMTSQRSDDDMATVLVVDTRTGSFYSTGPAFKDDERYDEPEDNATQGGGRARLVPLYT